MSDKVSPLDAVHRELKAKMAPFGGWEMPISYPSGTLLEHEACRQGAALFDVSHLGTVRVSGDKAFDLLQKALTNDLNKISVGRAQYTHLLDVNDASVLDDIIVWWVGDDVFDVMPNASNTTGVQEAIGGVDTTNTRAIIAVQGPTARKVVGAFSRDAADVGRFRVKELDLMGVACTVAGTGYTGEDGLELAVPVAHATSIWNALVQAGGVPAGLGARDTLRLEAGLPLHGHELGKGINSLEAGLEWVVSWDKGAFRGRDALLAKKESGLSKRLVGIEIQGRRPARDGTEVLSQGKSIGYVSSGNFSPTLGHCIAMAFVTIEVSVGQKVDLDVRGSLIEGVITALPFVAKKK